MIPLIAAVFTASLLGSLHCAGMCGAFAAFAVGADPVDGNDTPGRSDVTRAAPAAHPRWALNAAYNLGRLVTYTILGAIAGSFGAAVDLGGSAAGVQRAAAMLAGGIMAVVGVVVLLRTVGVRLPSAPLPAPLRAIVTAGHRAAFGFRPLPRALVIGLLTTLLPCGWLYAFAVTASGTGSPTLGAMTMAVFWMGTLPVMATIGAGVQSIAGPMRRRLPALTALALVGVGLFTLSGRLGAPMAMRTPAALSPARHVPATGADDGASADAAVEEQVSRVKSLDSSDMPCCHGH